jgi:hypothetical protein
MPAKAGIHAKQGHYPKTEDIISTWIPAKNLPE